MEQQERFTMKELPEEERPYERLETKGAASLSDAELLAIILKTGRNGETSLEMSRRLLCQAEDQKPGGALPALLNLSLEELMRFPGIGKVKALQMKALQELAIRLAYRQTQTSSKVVSAEGVAMQYIPRMRDLKKEEIHGIWLDNRLRILGDSMLSLGSVNQALLSPREVFLEAFRYKAVYFILIHNHPSGDPAPSSADIAGTHRILDASRILEVGLIDHIITGDGRYFSMKEEGLI